MQQRPSFSTFLGRTLIAVGLGLTLVWLARLIGGVIGGGFGSLPTAVGFYGVLFAAFVVPLLLLGRSLMRKVSRAK